MQKEIILDFLNDTAEIKIETKNFVGMKCVQESQFLKDALGEEIEVTLLPIAFQKENEVIREYKGICG